MVEFGRGELPGKFYVLGFLWRIDYSKRSKKLRLSILIMAYYSRLISPT